METYELVIRIEDRVEGGHYRVVAETRDGEKEGCLELPFPPDELPGVLEDIAAQVIYAGAGVRDLAPPLNGGTRRVQPRELGRILFERLFTGGVGQAYFQSLGRAGDTSSLRITLKLATLPEIMLVPWELLFDGKSFLALSRWSPVIRYLLSPTAPAPADLKPPLKILVVMADRSDSLELKWERQAIEQALSGIEGITLSFLPDADFSSLRRSLDKLKPNVIHFMGHGSLAANGGGHIVLKDRKVSGETLAFLFSETRCVRLVFLNACLTAHARTGQAFAGVATSLVVNAGVPFVVAMQFRISDGAAIAFCGEFYQRLAKGSTIEEAVAEGRQEVLFHKEEGSLEWATPVLFSRVLPGALRGSKIDWSDQVISHAPPAVDRDSLLKVYLEWLVTQNESLELPGLPENGQRQSVPLETVYIELRGDLVSPFERSESQAALIEQARQLEDLASVEDITAEQRSRMAWRQVSLVAQDPLPTSIEERDRPALFGRSEQRSLTLAEAFRRERCLVILGDPGSGKTTLVRWLTLRLAQAALAGSDRVSVPAHQIDPSVTPSASEPVDLGPVRIPLLLRVAAFARAWQTDASLTLEGFLGGHLPPDAGRKMDVEALGELFRDLLDKERAVVLLDGLDEISDPADRHEIVRAIDAFLRNCLGSSFPSDGRHRARRNDTPSEAGGNQVVVTSRIVGYQMAPLGQSAAHFTVEAMSTQAVDRFCDLWIRACNRATVGADRWSPREEKAAAQEAEVFKRAIADLHRRGAGELASNPLLVTILGLVFRAGHASFPRQRAKLYDTTVSMLIERWRERARARKASPLSAQEVRAILAPLAADIHQRSGVGVIDESELRACLEHHLGPQEADLFLDVVRRDVGLLTARGEGVYGFLHLTFQEYLAGFSLVQDRSEAGARLLEKLTAPRWREPILLALGQLSSEMAETDLEALLLGLLRRPDPLGDLVPRAALLLVAALPEMERIPVRALQEAAHQLLITYANRALVHRFPPLAEQIERAVRSLITSEHAGEVDRILLQALLPANSADRPSLLLPAAHLIRAVGHFTPEITEALIEAIDLDGVPWGWPVDRALRFVACHDPDLLPSPPGTLRRTLMREPGLAKVFLSQPEWLRLGLILYGGLDQPHVEAVRAGRGEAGRLKRRIRELESLKQDPVREKALLQAQAEWVTAEEKLARLERDRSWFAIPSMHRESAGLTPLIVNALRLGLQPRSLVPSFWELWRTAAEPSVRRDALLALLSLGEPLGPALEPGGAPPTDVAAHLSRITQILKIAVPHVLPPTLAALGRLAATCPAQRWADMVRAVLDTAIGLEHPPVDIAELEAVAPEDAKPIVGAELWSYHFSGTEDDPRYRAAVILDDLGPALSNPPFKLAQALALSATTVNGRAARGRGWAVEPLAPVPEESVDVLTTALDAIAGIPFEFDFVRLWALGCLRPLLSEGLLTEAVIVALGLSTWDLRADGLSSLSSERDNLLGLLHDVHPSVSILERARHIKHPYLRFRCLWRLHEYFRDLHTTFWNEWFQTARAIEVPRWQAWAFEQLAVLCDQDSRPKALVMAAAAARQIPSAVNRVRTFARLGSRFPGVVEIRDLLRQALLEAERIQDRRERAETLTAIRPLLAGEDGLQLRFNAVLAAFGDDTYNRAKARGLSGPMLDLLASDPGASSDQGLIVLGAQISDLRLLLALPNNLEGLWVALADGREAAMEVLAVRGRSRGLQFNLQAAVALERVLATHGAVPLAPLLPLVQNPLPATLPLIEGWLAHEDPLLRGTAHLLLAEAGEISVRTLPELVNLLKCPVDRLRHRSALVLHGRFNRNDEPWTTSALGTAALDYLASEALRHDREPAIALALVWAFQRLHHDDGQALSRWAKLLASGREGASESEVLLRSIAFVHDNAWPTFLDLFAAGDLMVQKALFYSLCALLHNGRISDDVWGRTVPILHRLSSQVVTHKIVLDIPAAFTEAAEAVLARGGSHAADRIAFAERAFASAGISIAHFLQQDPGTLRTVLAAIGGLGFVGPQFYERIRQAAERGEKNPEILCVLLEWLDQSLRQGISSSRRKVDHRQSDLLSLVSALAERLPNTFLNKARTLPLLSRSLCEVVDSLHSYPGRQAAIVLLSYLRTVTTQTLSALRSGMRDRLYVQKTVLESVGRFRRIDPDLLPRLFVDLAEESPGMAYATAGLLTAIARNVHLPSEIRASIISALADAVKDERSRRNVYLLVSEKGFDNYEIVYCGRLEEALYRALVELSGAVDLTGTATKAAS